MNNIDTRTLHNEAMNEAQWGEIAKMNGDKESSLKHFRIAFEKEYFVLQTAIQNQYPETNLGIIIKSCAALAQAIGDYLKAEQLICLGLSGNIPDMLREELRNMYEDVTFYRHMELKGVDLQPSEIQICMAGNDIAFGMGSTDSVISRIDTFKTLSIRTAERCSSIPFRKSGKPNSKIVNMYQSYLSVPRAASLSFTIRFATPGTYDMGRDFIPSVNIIEDITKNISYIQNNEYEKLQSCIPDNTYRNNFVSLVKELAPDGENIKLFGITSLDSEGNILMTPLRKTRDEISLNSLEFDNINNHDGNSEADKEILTIKGILKAASGFKSEVSVKNFDSDGTEKIKVPEGLADIVKKYFEEEVIVKIEKEGKNKNLISIDPVQ